ncbi:hypothetical protein E2562_006497 [Oryza meyeriana var. granulata]|uniref:BED-type domain-containing protein n=1 Tax=Oryza meyeriana var. granulata TaxID=110450 RepID=A0A6G1CNZ3_9ORYZ|nr:hypothetical protein E2562_006497 [Oryza meyeriana var. granulata]
MLGELKAQCMYCGKKLSAKSNSGTKHLHDHLKGCPYLRSKFAPKDKNVTQASLRKDIMDTYMEEKKKALQYMAGTKSRVSIITDMWTSENQKRDATNVIKPETFWSCLQEIQEGMQDHPMGTRYPHGWRV